MKDFQNLLHKVLKESEGIPSLIKERDHLIKLEVTYRLMLHYMAEGFDDPDRVRILSEIQEDTLRYADMVERFKVMNTSPKPYYEALRMVSYQKSTLNQRLELLLNSINTQQGDKSKQTVKFDISFPQALGDFFNYIWTIFGKDDTELEQLNLLILNKDLPLFIRELALSAILMENWEFFDYKSFNILLNLYEESDEIEISAKAITSIILIALQYPERLMNLPDISARLKMSFADNEKSNSIKEIMIALLREIDTPRIHNKIKKNMEDLAKINPSIFNNTLNSISESKFDESNPDWEEILEKSGLADKFREINDLQMEGADIMHLSFSPFQKSHPFFKKIHNHFIPFIPNHPELASAFDFNDENTVKRFQKLMCNTDLYSFFFYLKNVPAQQRDMVLSQLEEKIKEAEEAMESITDNSKVICFNNVVKFYIQEIYRLFTDKSLISNQKNIFQTPIDKNHFDNLKNIFGFIPEGLLEFFAEFYFKYSYDPQAVNLLLELDKTSNSDHLAWQKIGFSYSRMQQYHTALEWYRKAEIIDPENLWLIKKIAATHRNLKNFNEALSYYNKALGVDSENFNLLLSAGLCAIEIEDYDTALEKLYHADYLNNGHIQTKRAIAWAEFMNHKFDKANELYNSIISSGNAEIDDYINSGHVHLVKGDIQKALNQYSLSLKIIDNDKSTIEAKPVVSGQVDKRVYKLNQTFNHDYEFLKKFNVSPETILMVKHKLIYDLS